MVAANHWSEGQVVGCGDLLGGRGGSEAGELGFSLHY